MSTVDKLPTSVPVARLRWMYQYVAREDMPEGFPVSAVIYAVVDGEKLGQQVAVALSEGAAAYIVELHNRNMAKRGR